MKVMPTCCCRVLSSIWSCLRSLASSAPSGSSSSSTAGFSTKARASATRCCCPPDICTGRRFSKPVSWTRASASPTRRLTSLGSTFARRRPKATLSKTFRCGKQRIALEDGVDGTAMGRRLGHVDAVEQDLALGRLLEAGDHAQGRRLAAARGAQQREELARRHVQIDPVHGVHIAEALDEIDQLDFAAAHRTTCPCLSRPMADSLSCLRSNHMPPISPIIEAAAPPPFGRSPPGHEAVDADRSRPSAAMVK